MTAEHSQRLREVGQETDRGWKACTGHQRESEQVAVIKKGGIMKTNLILIISLVISISGCVQTVYTKSVTVKKDVKGQIVERLETETVSQPGTGWGIKFEHLKGVQP